MHWDSLLCRCGIGKSTTESDELGDETNSTTSGFSGRFSLQMQLAIGLLLAVTIGITTVQLWPRLNTLKVTRDQYPVSAFEFMARHNLTGKMVCTFNWAQYALAAFGPHEPGQSGILVQIDGRCRTSYSQAMLDAHFDFLMGPPHVNQRYRDARSGDFDPERVLREGNPDLVLISRLHMPSVEVMQRQNGRWTLLYQDALAQLWGLAERFDNAQSADYLPPPSREITENPQTGHVLWPALPKAKLTRATAESLTSL